MDRKSLLAMILIAIILITMPYYQEYVLGIKPEEKPAVSKSDSSEVIKNNQRPNPVEQIASQQIITPVEAENQKERSG